MRYLKQYEGFLQESATKKHSIFAPNTAKNDETDKKEDSEKIEKEPKDKSEK